MTSSSARRDLDWLTGNRSLQELMERYPSDWKPVGRDLAAAIEDGRAQLLNEFSRAAGSEFELWMKRIRASKMSREVVESALPHLARSRMALLAVDKCYLAAATGKASGKIRFNLLNGIIIQKLLFSRHLTRKMASIRWFRFWWPFITQKRLLMPLVQRRGIYCFYSRSLIERLSPLIGDRFCLEIGAGDGTLARFLQQAGVKIRATDDHSWSHIIQYPESVERLEAGRALEKYRPQGVICSWPPPDNDFERRVFSTQSVDLFIVIGSRYPFASGNWNEYRRQRDFEGIADPDLSSLVLPPDLESSVIIFRRRNHPSH